MRHFERIGVTIQVDAHRIAHRDEIHAGALGDLRDRVVPGDHAHALLSLALHLLKQRDGDVFHRPLAFPMHGRANRRILARFAPATR